MPDYDVIILGGGPGGYIAAERLGQARKSVLLIEKGFLGGTCLNAGCIPTKALLNSVNVYDQAKHSAPIGVSANQVSYDWETMQSWKAKSVSTLVGGVSQMMKQYKVRVIHGEGRMVGPTTVEVDGAAYTATDVILATGSVPFVPPIPGVTGNPAVVDSTGLLTIDAVPERLAVVGAGVIGIEFASIFSRLGTAVTVVEMMDEVLPFMEPSLAARLRGCMPEVDFRLGVSVESINDSSLSYSEVGETHQVDADLILMAAGRRPAVDGWGADVIGLDMGPAGITVDDRMRTSIPHVWAVGDVTGRSLLAHAAYRMGEIAAAQILDPDAGEKGQVMRWDTVPWALYSSPEAAGVGLTEEECAKRGIEVTTSSVPLVLSGRFVAESGLSRAGAVTIIAESGSRVIRGIQAIGPYTPEMIWGAAAVLEMEFTVDDVRQLVFPHPTISEGIREAAWAFPD